MLQHDSEIKRQEVEQLAQDNDKPVIIEAVEQAFAENDLTDAFDILESALSQIRTVANVNKSFESYINEVERKTGNTALHTCVALHIEKGRILMKNSLIQQVAVQELEKEKGRKLNVKTITDEEIDQQHIEHINSAPKFLLPIMGYLIKNGANSKITNLEGVTAISDLLKCTPRDPVTKALRFQIDEESLLKAYEPYKAGLNTIDLIQPRSAANANKDGCGCIIM